MHAEWKARGSQKLIKAAVGAGVAMAVPGAVNAESAVKAGDAGCPNIILIFADDLGYGDLGCFGSPNIKTPHLDKMAAEGVKFKSFYAAPVCGPSRAQLMTGSYSVRTGSGHNEVPLSPTGLNPNEVTMAEVLKDAGYRTMHIGKWHLGDAPEFMPTSQGFDQFWGFPYSHDMWPYHPLSSSKRIESAPDRELMKQMLDRKKKMRYTAKGSWEFPDLPLFENETVIEKNPKMAPMTTRFTEKALEFIDANKDRPFFLYMAHTMPHTPLFVSEKFSGKSERGLYGDAVMEMDWSCGQIFKKLKELNIDDNTLVVFSSDNGPTTKYGKDGGSAGVLRGGKGTQYEGGVRVPTIFRWPNTIPAGVKTDSMASTIDLLPTFASLAKTGVPTDRTIDGRDLTPLMTGKTSSSPHEYLHYMVGGRGGSSKMNYKAVRNQKWKLFVKMSKSGKVSPTELYNLETDVSEKKNVLKQNQAIAKAMAADATVFLKELIKNKRPVGRVSK